VPVGIGTPIGQDFAFIQHEAHWDVSADPDSRGNA
jgi:hypothetical protein